MFRSTHFSVRNIIIKYIESKLQYGISSFVSRQFSHINIQNVYSVNFRVFDTNIKPQLIRVPNIERELPVEFTMYASNLFSYFGKDDWYNDVSGCGNLKFFPQ